MPSIDGHFGDGVAATKISFVTTLGKTEFPRRLGMRPQHTGLGVAAIQRIPGRIEHVIQIITWN